MEDSEIIRLYCNRSEKAILETEEKYGKYCRSIAFSILRNKEDAEECVNDVYCKLWNSVPSLLPKNLKAFIGRITRNQSLDYVRIKSAGKRASQQYKTVFDELDHALSLSNASDDFDDLEFRDCLNRFLKTLPPNHRDVFIGRYWYFDSIAEISDKMGFSHSKTKMILMKCRNMLKDYLHGEEDH